MGFIVVFLLGCSLYLLLGWTYTTSIAFGLYFKGPSSSFGLTTPYSIWEQKNFPLNKRMVHASLALSVDEIFLNSSLVIALNKAFIARLLKFVALILSTSYDIGGSIGLVHPTSIASQTFSSRDCKKVLICTCQYA